MADTEDNSVRFSVFSGLTKRSSSNIGEHYVTTRLTCDDEPATSAGEILSRIELAEASTEGTEGRHKYR